MAEDETLPRVASGCGRHIGLPNFQAGGGIPRMGLTLTPWAKVSSQSSFPSDATRLLVACPAILWQNTARRRALRTRSTSPDTRTSSAARHQAGSRYRKDAGA